MYKSFGYHIKQYDSSLKSHTCCRDGRGREKEMPTGTYVIKVLKSCTVKPLFREGEKVILQLTLHIQEKLKYDIYKWFYSIHVDSIKFNNFMEAMCWVSFHFSVSYMLQIWLMGICRAQVMVIYCQYLNNVVNAVKEHNVTPFHFSFFHLYVGMRSCF